MNKLPWKPEATATLTGITRDDFMLIIAGLGHIAYLSLEQHKGDSDAAIDLISRISIEAAPYLGQRDGEMGCVLPEDGPDNGSNE